MAREAHLRVIGQGVYNWNAWREKNETIIPRLICANLLGADLVGADLVHAEMPRANLSQARLVGANLSGATAVGADFSKAELSGVKLIGTALTGANLRGANLSMANLSGANLSHADLSGATLIHANLIGANLLHADLSRANLSGADLSAANLMHADLNGANLSLAVLSQTVFSAVDLRTVCGLATCQHLGPSVLDHWTLARSGALPLGFLRACGLPDHLIAHWRGQHAQNPHPAADYRQNFACFIVHVRADHDFAEQLRSDLQSQGIRCWLAPQDGQPGAKFRSAVDDPSGAWERVVLVISEHCKSSNWLVKFVKAALAREAEQNLKSVFPVFIDGSGDSLPPGPLTQLQQSRDTADFRDWRRPAEYWHALQSFRGLLRAGCGPSETHPAKAIRTAQ